MLSLPSQLLLRNAELFSKGQWALVNPEDTQVFSELSGDITGLHQYFDKYKAACKQNANKHYFAASFEAHESPYDGIVIYMPKAKQHLDMLLANMAYLIKPSGLLMVVGENKAGIKSVPKQLEMFGIHINKLDSAKHCALISCEVQSPASSFDINKYAETRSYHVNEHQLKVFSLPGVFGHKQFDPGTQLLLQQFNKPEELRKMRGKLYDFACGTGIIGSYFAKANTKLKITMSDISALAVYCSEQTLRLNELQADVIASDGMQEIHQHFEHIVSNPPFHDGRRNDYGITQGFIKDAHAKGNRGSRLTMVANRFLPYPEHIERTFFKFETLCKTNKFCVYQGTK